MVEDIFELNKVINHDIVEVIEKYHLDSISKARHRAYKRYYLYNILRTRRHLSLSMIGRFFNRDHATVMYGLKEHAYWWGKKDIQYLKDIQPLTDIIDAQTHNVGIFNVNIDYVDVEKSSLTITGNFNLNLLDKLPEQMTKEELVNVFKILK